MILFSLSGAKNRAYHKTLRRTLSYSKLWLITLGILVGIFCLPMAMGQTVLATNQTSPLKGLTVSPSINYLKANAGQSLAESINVTNNTSHILVVNLSTGQFSFNNYIYSYQFLPSSNRWVHLTQTQVVLEPGKEQAIPYQLMVPSGSRPGSSYFSLFVSASGLGGSLHDTIQAASLIFLTVNGKLTYGSKLINPSIQRVVFGSQISYTFNMEDMGNEYYFINAFGALHGLTASNAVTGVSHLVVPGKILSVSGTIPHPILPGIYRAEFGYSPSSGSRVEVQRLIIYIPPWFIALVLIVLLAGNIIYLKKHQSTKEQPKK